MTETPVVETPVVETPVTETQSTEAPSWNSGFNEDQVVYADKKGWKDPSGLLKSYQELEKYTGGAKNLFEMPAPDDVEGMSKLYDKLGKPETSDAYTMDEFEADDAFKDMLKETFHKGNMNTSQAKEVVDALKSYKEQEAVSKNSEFDRMMSENEAKLKSEWGGAYDERIAEANAARNALEISDEQFESMKNILGPGFVNELLYNANQKFGEGGAAAVKSEASTGMSPAEARAKISEMSADPVLGKALIEADHPHHEHALNKLKQYQKAARATA